MVLVLKSEGNKLFERPGCGEKYDIKMFVRKRNTGECELCVSVSVQGKVAGSCEHSNKLLD